MKIKIEIELSEDYRAARITVNDGPSHCRGADVDLSESRAVIRGQLLAEQESGEMLPVWFDVRPFVPSLRANLDQIFSRSKNET